MYITKLNSFDEVAKCYEKTPVLKSKLHPVEHDVRPIGDRSRKWERIIRVDTNTYALSCGGQTDPVFNWGWREKATKFPLTAKEIAYLHPIVWCKHKDGTETITIRNGRGEHQHNNIYSFLHRALPRDLWFRANRQGRHAIYNRSEGEEYYLPKTRTVPRYVYEYYKENAENSSWAREHMKACQLEPDNLGLTFKRNPDGRFELVGTAPKEMVKRIRVAVSEKAKFKSHINELYEWVSTMYPLLKGQLGWDLRRQMDERLKELANEHNISGYKYSWRKLFESCELELVRSILSDPHHPMRYEFGVAAMFEIDGAVSGRDEDEVRKVARAAYTKWINNIAGFSSVIKEAK